MTLFVTAAKKALYHTIIIFSTSHLQGFWQKLDFITRPSKRSIRRLHPDNVCFQDGQVAKWIENCVSAEYCAGHEPRR